MECAAARTARTAAFPGSLLLLIVLLLLLEVGPLATAGPSPGPGTRPEAPGDRRGSLGADRHRQDSNDYSDKGSNKCQPCRSGHFRQGGVSGGMRPAAASRRPPTASRRRSRARGSCGGVCRQCSVCPRGWRVHADCTATRDTACARCRPGEAWDQVRSRCRTVSPLIHEVVVVLPNGSTASPPPPPTVAGQTLPVRRAADPGSPGEKLGRRPAGGSAAEEAKSERWSAGYVASLFASGAAGVTVLILVVVVLIYAWLRCKQWEYERSLSSGGTCSYFTCSSCFKSLCKKDIYAVASDTDYSTRLDRNTEVQPPLNDAVAGVDSEMSTSGRQTHAQGDTAATVFQGDAPSASSGEERQPDGRFVRRYSSRSEVTAEVPSAELPPLEDTHTEMGERQFCPTWDSLVFERRRAGWDTCRAHARGTTENSALLLDTRPTAHHRHADNSAVAEVYLMSMTLREKLTK